MTLEEVKAYLRIDGGGEDAVIAGMIGAAVALCEQFIGQWLLRRAAEDVLPASAEWTRLKARPVVAITSVMGVPEQGDAFVLPVDAYAIDIDGNGDGWVRMTRPGAAARVRVGYTAGLAVTDAALPEAIRQGVIRMAAEHYARRDGGEVVPPAAVTALWRPWRRMRLS